jgi:membrane protein insertase Oxa1/YidC/SpoIIIJ
LYAFVPNPGSIDTFFLDRIDLSKPHLVMAVVAGILQFFQTKMLLARRPPPKLRKEKGARDEDMLATMNQTMVYFAPIMTVVIGVTLPGGLTLYWIVMNALAIVQQAMVLRGGKGREGQKGHGTEGTQDMESAAPV